MVIDCGQVLKTLDGRELIDHDSEGNVVQMSLGRIIANALLIPEKNDDGVAKIAKYDLALRAYKGDRVAFEIEEVALIKRAVIESYAPLVCGQAVRMLE
jgi:hypothetical protein